MAIFIERDEFVQKLTQEENDMGFITTLEELHAYRSTKLTPSEIENLKNTVPALHHEIKELTESLGKSYDKIGELKSLLFDGTPALMTSAIGLLPVNSPGLRMAVDEITRLKAENYKLNSDIDKAIDEIIASDVYCKIIKRIMEQRK